MKKFLVLGLLLICLFISGCGKKNETEVFKKFSKTIENLKSYHLEGKLEMMNNETVYTYDVDVSYEKTDQFRVSLKNTINDHEQIILRNKEGVYV